MRRICLRTTFLRFFPAASHRPSFAQFGIPNPMKKTPYFTAAVSLLVTLSRLSGLHAFQEPPAKPANPPSIAEMQAAAIEAGTAEFGHWGTDPARYTGWTSHSNRLIPVYTYGTKGAGEGVDLQSWFGERSPYRSAAALQKIYGYLPEQSVNPQAVWMDQTNLFDIQKAAAAAGKKHIFLVVFDGMDWQTTYAAALWNRRAVTYREGRGDGTHFQRYDAAGTSQFGFMVTSPHNEGTDVDVDQQKVQNPGGEMRGGYAAEAAGNSPWDTPPDPGYLIGKGRTDGPRHAYTDSSSSASSMTAGIKTFNGAINVDAGGQPVATIAHQLQEQGWLVGAVSSVPISHATPAAAYAHNVARDDYQDLTRDLLGLPSIAHPQQPLPGLDVIIGGGFGTTAKQADGVKKQGQNFVAGNVYLTEQDLQTADVRSGGRYATAVRTAGADGTDVLNAAARSAAADKTRLLGFFGQGSNNGHLPFATADGDYVPSPGVGKKAETYSAADLQENPTLAEMTTAAIQVLSREKGRFWLMVEPGDVDWANHDDNLDNSIGAVNSGDAAVKVITDWVEQNSNWNESLLIVTADHGHMLNLTKPEAIAAAAGTPIARLADPPGIHNLLQVSSAVYSGSEPEGEPAFRSLQALGVKMIVSVDGAEPDVAQAAAFGLRYVHIPIGYDGIDSAAALALARAAREAEGKMYVHCHHGRHRGPAAAAVACMATGAMTAEQAGGLLALAGTSPDYAGLWRDVAGWQRPAADAVLPELQASAGTASLAAAMARLDRHFDVIRVARKNDWKTAGENGTAAFGQAAVLVTEELRESQRLAAGDYDARFRTLLQQSEREATALADALKQDRRDVAAQQLTKLEKTCSECHREYRN